MTAERPNRKQLKAGATRNRLLAEATRLFARQGYHKTTISDLAQAIEMTAGAVFHHFESKEEVLRAVLERLARGLEDYRACLDGPGSSHTVHRIMAHMIEHYNRQPEATICLAALATEFAGSSDPVVDDIRRVYERFVGPFEDALRSHPRVRSPRAAAVAFIGAVQGIGIQGMLRGDQLPIEELAAEFLHLLADW